jgi:hypothetical protein
MPVKLIGEDGIEAVAEYLAEHPALAMSFPGPAAYEN